MAGIREFRIVEATQVLRSVHWRSHRLRLASADRIVKVTNEVMNLENNARIDVLAALILSMGFTGCASVAPSHDDVRDRSHDYQSHRDIGAPPGSGDNPDAGVGVIVGLLQFLFHN